MKMIRNLGYGALLLLLSSLASAEDNSSGTEFREPVFPVVLGAALITYGAYELGENVEDSQRNVQLLWGGALLASIGIALYQSSQEKGSEVVIAPVNHGGITLAYNYRF